MPWLRITVGGTTFRATGNIGASGFPKGALRGVEPLFTPDLPVGVRKSIVGPDGGDYVLVGATVRRPTPVPPAAQPPIASGKVQPGAPQGEALRARFHPSMGTGGPEPWVDRAFRAWAGRPLDHGDVARLVETREREMARLQGPVDSARRERRYDDLDTTLKQHREARERFDEKIALASLSDPESQLPRQRLPLDPTVEYARKARAALQLGKASDFDLLQAAQFLHLDNLNPYAGLTRWGNFVELSGSPSGAEAMRRVVVARLGNTSVRSLLADGDKLYLWIKDLQSRRSPLPEKWYEIPLAALPEPKVGARRPVPATAR